MIRLLPFLLLTACGQPNVYTSTPIVPYIVEEATITLPNSSITCPQTSIYSTQVCRAAYPDPVHTQSCITLEEKARATLYSQCRRFHEEPWFELAYTQCYKQYGKHSTFSFKLINDCLTTKLEAITLQPGIEE